VRFVPGDIVAEVDGTPVKDVGEVCDILESKSPGDTVLVKGLDYESDYKEYEVRAKLEE
jgi:PDZ domain-containing secreted protein